MATMERGTKGDRVTGGTNKTTYWVAQREAFISSFKSVPSKRFFRSALFDLLMILSVIIILNATFIFVNLVSASAMPKLLEVYELREGADVNSEDYIQAVSELAPLISRIFWLSLLIGIVGFVLVAFFVSLFYGKAWTLSLKKRFSKKYLKKYFVVNLLWFLFLGIVLVFTATVFKMEYAAVILLIELLLILYLDPVLRAVFDEKKKLGENIKRFWGVAKYLNWFVFVLVFSLVIWLILLVILGLVAGIVPLFVILFLIFTTVFIGWLRNYIIQLVAFLTKAKKV